MRDQDVLKAFDYDATDEDPYLTVKEVTAALAEHFGIEVSDEAVRIRLEALRDDEMVAKRRFGAGVAYRALVGPQLAADVEAESNERRRTAREEFVDLEN
jgi:predicted transcriptional regulator